MNDETKLTYGLCWDDDDGVRYVGFCLRVEAGAEYPYRMLRFPMEKGVHMSAVTYSYKHFAPLNEGVSQPIKAFVSELFVTCNDDKVGLHK